MMPLTGMLPVMLATAGVLWICYRLAMGLNPSTRIYRLFERACLGVCALYLWNLAAGGAGWALGVNWTTVAAAGTLGLPGLAVLAAIKALL